VTLLLLLLLLCKHLLELVVRIVTPAGRAWSASTMPWPLAVLDPFNVALLDGYISHLSFLAFRQHLELANVCLQRGLAEEVIASDCITQL
jgi:hypothetical protein